MPRSGTSPHLQLQSSWLRQVLNCPPHMFLIWHLGVRGSFLHRTTASLLSSIFLYGCCRHTRSPGKCLRKQQSVIQVQYSNLQTFRRYPSTLPDKAVRKRSTRTYHHKFCKNWNPPNAQTLNYLCARRRKQDQILLKFLQQEIWC